MNINNLKKLRRVLFLSLILIGWTSLLLLNPVESKYYYNKQSKLEKINKESIDLSVYPPLLNDLPENNIIFQQLPNTDLLDNSEIISSFYEYLEDDIIIYDRPPSIIATYFIVSILDLIDSDLLLTKSDMIFKYLVDHYNPQLEIFEDNINYTYYNTGYGDGKQLLLSPYTPEITHEMALVILKKCNRLSAFSGAQITNWISEIWGNQNIDGGFGSLHSPNSTLLETYYAIESLLVLNDYDTGIFSVIQKNAIRSYIESRQRRSDWTTFGIGAFGEYSVDIFIGWEFFYASWLALNSINMIGGDFSNVKDDFINFILDNDLNNPNTHCFYGQWNDKASPDIITYYGTAILGECIRLLNAEAQFPDIYNSQSTLISANIIQQTGLDMEYNYFYWASDVPGDDLFSQYLIVNYLSNIGVWNLVDELEFIDYYLSFLTEHGGGTYISNIWNSAKGDFLKFHSPKYSGVNDSPVFDLVMSRKFSTYFGDLRNISTNVQDQSYKILQHWNEWAYYPIATNYFSINLLNEYELMDEFSNEVGVEYDDFIWWIHGKLTPEGYFSNSPEFMISGSLESTFYAVQSQKFLLDYDLLHNIYDYYTLQEINSVLSYCEQFIIEDNDYWYVNCSQSLENKDLGRFQSINYVVSIEEILKGNGIDYDKLENFLLNIYETQWDVLSMQEKTNLLGLMDKINATFSDLDTLISHLQIKNQLHYIITQDHFPEDEVNYISQLLKNSDVTVFMDIPANQIMGESYTYFAQFSSIATLISVENISIRGPSTSFYNWYSWGSMVACEVIPQFDDISPNSWDVELEFDYRIFNYSYPFSVNLSIPFSSTLEIESTRDSLISTLSIECPDSLAIILESVLFVYDFEDNLIENYSVVNMSITHNQDIIDFYCEIENLLINHTYTLVWQFNYDFLDNITFEIEFLGNIPPILFNETISSIGNTTTDPNFYPYIFSITYSDNENNPPENVSLFISEIPYLMEYQYGDFQSGADFSREVYLEIGNYTYYFVASDGYSSMKYPEIDHLYLTVTNLPNVGSQNESTKLGNYIIEGLISLGSVGTGVSSFIFRNKQKNLGFNPV